MKHLKLIALSFVSFFTIDTVAKNPVTIPEEINNVIIVDREKSADTSLSDCSFLIKLPPIFLKNKKLKKIIDQFVEESYNWNGLQEPTRFYLRKTKDGLYEFWKIIPELGFTKSFYDKNTIGFYQMGNVCMFIDKSMRKDVKPLKRDYEEFELSADYQIMNIDPVLTVDLKQI